MIAGEKYRTNQDYRRLNGMVRRPGWGLFLCGFSGGVYRVSACKRLEDENEPGNSSISEPAVGTRSRSASRGLIKFIMLSSKNLRAAFDLVLLPARAYPADGMKRSGWINWGSE